MKKKVLLIVILGLLFGSAAWYGCGLGLSAVAERTMPDSWQLKPDTFGTIKPCGVNMTVSILPDKKIEISVSNKTEMFLEFGRGADVQIRKHGQWFTIFSTMSDPIKLDLIELAPSETWSETPFALLSSNQAFPTGQYRAIKQFTLISEDQEEQVICAACEFTIGE